MSQAVFHLGVTEADLNGATLAIIPGDPARVQKIAELMDNPVFLASHREYTLYRAELDGKSVVVTLLQWSSQRFLISMLQLQ